MNYVSKLEDKIELIKSKFSGLVGKEISFYELPQLWLEDEQRWDNWMDLPLVLTFGDQKLSISWQKFDELAIEAGAVVPYSLAGQTVRWLTEGVNVLDQVLGKRLTAVSLRKGQMSIETQAHHIWTDLLLSLDDGSTLAIFNALDENGIARHTTSNLDSQSIKCV
ncbi:MAG: hypothetical protein AAF490_18550 [Chloroflexota bacterium]